jgi:hypothetical protein
MSARSSGRRIVRLTKRAKAGDFSVLISARPLDVKLRQLVHNVANKRLTRGAKKQ